MFIFIYEVEVEVGYVFVLSKWPHVPERNPHPEGMLLQSEFLLGGACTWRNKALRSKQSLEPTLKEGGRGAGSNFTSERKLSKHKSFEHIGPPEAMLHPNAMLSNKCVFFVNIAAGGNALAPQGQR